MSVERLFLVASVGEIAEGRTKTFDFGINKGIVYNDRGVLKAYINRCTHMGGPVSLTTKKDGASVLRCSWHEAEFAPTTGEAIEGEAPKGTRLAPIELIEKEGKLYARLVLPPDPFDF
ncbi:Rieske 2Fe-2S domain-containing protein [Patescibacteria group bacterium]|nr:Rieske 2Fe-2S domain-containing protein [Patescibacteria group bacterium]